MKNNKKHAVDDEVRSSQHRRWWAPIVHFLVHAAQGFAIFGIIFAVSLALNALVVNMKHWGASPFTVTVFSSIEHFMVIVDAISFLWYILKTAYKALKEF